MARYYTTAARPYDVMYVNDEEQKPDGSFEDKRYFIFLNCTNKMTGKPLCLSMDYVVRIGEALRAYKDGAFEPIEDLRWWRQ